MILIILNPYRFDELDALLRTLMLNRNSLMYAIREERSHRIKCIHQTRKHQINAAASKKYLVKNRVKAYHRG